MFYQHEVHIADQETPDMDTYDCPQCGEPTPQLHEGYCRECCDDNQAALDRHNADYDRWQSLTDEQRQREIAKALCNR